MDLLPENMTLQERNGDVIFFDNDFFAILTCFVEENNFHRRIHLTSLRLVPENVRFDFNMLAPYFKEGLRIIVEEFKRDLDSPEKVKNALEKRILAGSNSQERTRIN